MTDAKLAGFWDSLWLVQDERFRLMKNTIRDAIAKGVHVEIIVDSESGVTMAWELWERIGFPQGSSEWIHVTIDAIPINNMWSRRDGLSIQYTSIAPPRRM